MERFEIVGLMTSEAYQKSKFITTKLYNCYPEKFQCPTFRSMLDVDWEQYLTKIRRKLGSGHKIWTLTKNVVIFLNGTYFGDDDELITYILTKYKINLRANWYEMGANELLTHLRGIISNYRHLVYITIAIRKHVIGSMLFQLYDDIVPLTCENFLKNDFSGAPITRIVKNSWIQFGNVNNPEQKIPCENYCIPHDRRGVLCMCNAGRHKLNSTKFFLTLDPTPWMDYHYVAFGQLIQGANVLRLLENLPAENTQPNQKVSITNCGIFSLDAICQLNTESEIEDFLRKIQIFEPSPEPDAQSIDFNVLQQRDLPYWHLNEAILLYLKQLEFEEPATENKNSNLRRKLEQFQQYDDFPSIQTPSTSFCQSDISNCSRIIERI